MPECLSLQPNPLPSLFQQQRQLNPKLNPCRHPSNLPAIVAISSIGCREKLSALIKNIISCDKAVFAYIYLLQENID